MLYKKQRVIFNDFQVIWKSYMELQVLSSELTLLTIFREPKEKNVSFRSKGLIELIIKKIIQKKFTYINFIIFLWKQRYRWFQRDLGEHVITRWLQSIANSFTVLVHPCKNKNEKDIEKVNDQFDLRYCDTSRPSYRHNG